MIFIERNPVRQRPSSLSPRLSRQRRNKTRLMRSTQSGFLKITSWKMMIFKSFQCAEIKMGGLFLVFVFFSCYLLFSSATNVHAHRHTCTLTGHQSISVKRSGRSQRGPDRSRCPSVMSSPYRLHSERRAPADVVLRRSVTRYCTRTPPPLFKKKKKKNLSLLITAPFIYLAWNQRERRSGKLLLMGN